MTKVREEILNAEAELAEHRAVLNTVPANPQSAATNATDLVATNEAPAAKIREYRNVCMRLAQDVKEEQDLIVFRQLKEDTFYVQEIRAKIAEDENAKKKLEQEFPGLVTIISPVVSAANSGQPIAGGIDLATETSRVRMLEGKTNRLHMQLEQIRSEAAKLEDAEGPIQEYGGYDLQGEQLRHFCEHGNKGRM